MHRLQAIAGSPELYPELIRLGGLPHILALLSHDNSDIAASAIQLLRELTDADAIEDSVRFLLSFLNCLSSLSLAHVPHRCRCYQVAQGVLRATQLSQQEWRGGSPQTT